MSKPIEQVYDGIRLFNTNIKAARSKEEKDCLVWGKRRIYRSGGGAGYNRDRTGVMEKNRKQQYNVYNVFQYN
jgi:hypothetical protein